MADYIVKVPDHMLTAVKLGKAMVSGVRVIDSNSKVTLAHLQQTGKLASALASANPIGGGSAIVSAASGMAQNVQLEQIKGMLGTLQVVSGVGATAAVLNLGVSVVGFKIVCDKLNILNSKLDGLGKQITEVQSFLEAKQHASLMTAVERCDDAFDYTSPEAREGVWRNAEEKLHEHANFGFEMLWGGTDRALAVRNHAFQEGYLMNPGVPLDAVMQMVSSIQLSAQARITALMLLGEAKVARKYAQHVYDQLQGFKFGYADVVKSRLRGSGAGPAIQKELMNAVKPLYDFVQALDTQSDDLCKTLVLLEEKGIDTRDYIERVRNYPEATVLALPTEEGKQYFFEGRTMT